MSGRRTRSQTQKRPRLVEEIPPTPAPPNFEEEEEDEVEPYVLDMPPPSLPRPSTPTPQLGNDDDLDLSEDSEDVDKASIAPPPPTPGRTTFDVDDEDDCFDDDAPMSEERTSTFNEPQTEVVEEPEEVTPRTTRRSKRKQTKTVEETEETGEAETSQVSTAATSKGKKSTPIVPGVTFTVDEMVANCVFYFLVNQHRKRPVKRTELIRHAMNGQKDCFKEVFEKFKVQMFEKFGMKVEGLEMGKSDYVNYIITNTITDEAADDIFIDGKAKRALLLLILSITFMQSRPMYEDQIWKLITDLGFEKSLAKDVTQHPGSTESLPPEMQSKKSVDPKAAQTGGKIRDNSPKPSTSRAARGKAAAGDNLDEDAIAMPPPPAPPPKKSTVTIHRPMNSSDLGKFLKTEFVQSMYLTVEEPDPDKKEYVESEEADVPDNSRRKKKGMFECINYKYGWGPRAEKEFSKWSILKFVCKHMDMEPQDFDFHFNKCKEEEAESVQADLDKEKAENEPGANGSAIRITENAQGYQDCIVTDDLPDTLADLHSKICLEDADTEVEDNEEVDEVANSEEERSEKEDTEDEAETAVVPPKRGRGRGSGRGRGKASPSRGRKGRGRGRKRGSRGRGRGGRGRGRKVAEPEDPADEPPEETEEADGSDSDEGAEDPGGGSGESDSD